MIKKRMKFSIRKQKNEIFSGNKNFSNESEKVLLTFFNDEKKSIFYVIKNLKKIEKISDIDSSRDEKICMKTIINLLVSKDRFFVQKKILIYFKKILEAYSVRMESTLEKEENRQKLINLFYKKNIFKSVKIEDIISNKELLNYAINPNEFNKSVNFFSSIKNAFVFFYYKCIFPVLYFLNKKINFDLNNLTKEMKKTIELINKFL